MNIRALLLLAFVCVQLGLWATVLDSNQAFNFSKTNAFVQKTVTDGLFNKVQTDEAVISQNMGAKTQIVSQKKNDFHFFSAFAPSFQYSQKQKLTRYILNCGGYKNPSSLSIAYLTEVQPHAP